VCVEGEFYFSLSKCDNRGNVIYCIENLFAQLRNWVELLQSSRILYLRYTFSANFGGAIKHQTNLPVGSSRKLMSCLRLMEKSTGPPKIISVNGQSLRASGFQAYHLLSILFIHEKRHQSC